MKQCKCGSYAFNLYKEDIDQGDWCDVHYWKEKALAQPEREPLEYWNAVEGWVKIDEVREHFDSVGCGTIYKTAGEGRVPLGIANPTPPLECQTEAEKIAFAYGWWKALETKAQPPYRAVKTYAGGKPNYVTQQEPVAKYSDIVSDGGLDPRKTTPPQLTWVDLTDEQMWNAYTGGSDIINLDYAKSILQLFKEKNT